MRQDRNSAPLVAALRQKAEEGPDLFCIPAHRQGRGADPELRALLGERVFTADLTEMEGLDDLHAPSGVIAEAEAKAAAEAQAAAEAEAIKDEIKAVMNEQATEEMTVDTHIVRWTTTLSNRFDTTTFKKEHNEMYKQYTKQTTSRRFSIT